MTLFTQEDVELLRHNASRCLANVEGGDTIFWQGPSEAPPYTDLADRIQQYLAQQKRPHIERGGILPGEPYYVSSRAVRGILKGVVDETDLSEG